MKPVIYLTVESVLAIHEEVLAAHGGAVAFAQWLFWNRQLPLLRPRCMVNF
jgi:hypothetical protein